MYLPDCDSRPGLLEPFHGGIVVHVGDVHPTKALYRTEMHINAR